MRADPHTLMLEARRRVGIPKVARALSERCLDADPAFLRGGHVESQHLVCGRRVRRPRHRRHSRPVWVPTPREICPVLGHGRCQIGLGALGQESPTKDVRNLGGVADGDGTGAHAG